MVLKESILYSLDNSGAKKVKCIHIFSGFSKKTGKLGDILKVSIRKKDPLKKLTKKLYFSVIVNSKRIHRRENGHFLKFDGNRVILLSDQYSVIGTRILKPIAKEVSKKKLTQIMAMAFCIL